ncbi:MFS transporter [Serratia fonticola]|uniref:MFS transporter n=1 Tax=Serratia fonticola TaxID=47917 RepID=UPI002179BFBE|nr:MFS transporter [Serratia fonticola]CAI1870770.1 Arabinose efflux permease [Serratia fonticola]CAI2527624.1 Arabinose efflux permease [Serratia fonticola]
MYALNKAGAFTLLAVACLTIMVGCVIVPGLTEVAVNLGTPSAASWLVTIPSLGVVVFGPLAGRFIDKAGAHNALTWGLFLYGLLGSGGIFLHGLVPVMLDRLLLGGATAVVMSAGTTLISAFYSGHARMKMIASQGMSIELGGVIFLFIGGLLATIGWRLPFLLYLFAWLLLVMHIMFVPKLHSEFSEQFDEPEEGKRPEGAGKLKAVYFAAVFSMICFFTGIIVIPQHFHTMNIGAAETGYFLSFISLVAVFAAALMPRLVARLGEYGTLNVAFICYAAAHLLFCSADGIALFVAGGTLMGCGFGLSVPLVNHMTVEQSHAQVRGRNLAYLSMAIFSGQFLSSFMEFIPGSSSVVFLGAALIGVFVSITLRLFRRSRHNVVI